MRARSPLKSWLEAFVFFLVVAMALAVMLAASPNILATARAQESVLLLADLHFHPGPTNWGTPALPPQAMLQLMDSAGVRWAGNGTVGAPDDYWMPLVQAVPDRFIPFAGGEIIRAMIRSQGEAAWSMRSAEATRAIEAIGRLLTGGPFRGIGELHVNNAGSWGAVGLFRWPADSLLMQRLYALSVSQQAPLSIHMDAEESFVEQLEHLLAIDRRGIVIWAHCGWYADTSLVRRLLDEHSNLLCELSQRDDRGGRYPITGEGRQLKPDWKALLEKHANRFLVGTDATSAGEYQQRIAYYRAILPQLSPQAARLIAHENARMLFRLR